jgi:hypothetical protein
MEKLVSEYLQRRLSFPPTFRGVLSRPSSLIANVDMRILTWFSPCAWAEDGGYLGIRAFCHGTAVGRAITNAFWNILSGDVLRLNKYDVHPEMAKLKPWTQAFHTGCSFSILNYDTDFFDLVRNGTVKVHLADIDHLSPHKVHLADADHTVLESDALLCVTGWKHTPPLKFLPEGIDKQIGLPHVAATEASPTDLASQQGLFDRADTEILSRYPRLGDVPTFNKKYVPLADQKGFSAPDDDFITPDAPLTPFMLYHFVTPAQPHFLRAKDIAFAGYSTNFSNTITAHIQGLWISAFFDGKLARDPSAAVMGLTDGDGGDPGKSVADNKQLTLERIQYETVLHNRFGKWRYPTDHGSKYPDFAFDALPYLDMLIADLGLQVHRKNGWWMEIAEPYGPADYRNINKEWDKKFGKEGLRMQD